MTRLRVQQMRYEADGVVSVELADPCGAPLEPWTLGAHLDLVLTGEHTRPYSLCGDPDRRDSYRVAVLHEPSGSGGSTHVHEVLRVGHVVEVRGPRNHFRLEPATHHGFVAGGIGITPILPMVEHCARTGSPWSLTYGGRTRSSMAFLERLSAVDGPVTILAQDCDGVPDVSRLVADVPAGGLLYVCGPPGLIGAVRAAADQLRPDEDLVRFELFAVPEPASAPAEAAAGGSFVVELARHGGSVTVGPDTTILDEVLALGIDVPNDCREGICGSCITTILSGSAVHHDLVLTKREQAKQDCLMICCSRAAEDRLVLDL